MPKKTMMARPKNTGSITEIAPDKWKLSVYVGRDKAGRQRRKYRTVGGPRWYAEQKLAELQAEHGSRSKRTSTTSLVTVGEVLTQWQAAHRTHWTPSNIKNTKSIVESRLWEFEKDVVDELTAPEVRRFYDRLLRMGLSDGYVARIHSCLRSALGWAVSEGLCSTNPAAGVRRVAKKAKPKSIPTLEAVKAMIDSAQAHVAAYLQFALQTGARRGEMAALRWDDIEDVEGPYCRITFVRRISGGAVVDGLKASQSKSVIVSKGVVGRLREAARSDEWVFGRGDQPPSTTTLSRWFKLAKDDALKTHPDLNGTTLHSLRHLCGSAMLESGVTITQVSKQLGHASPAVTLQVYSHALSDDDTSAADIFGGL